MRKPISDELAAALGEMAKAAGGEIGHILTPRICDKCQDEKKEAFPYFFIDSEGKWWPDLCNDCYAESVGFSYCPGCRLPDEMCVCGEPTDEMPKPIIKIKWSGPGFYVAGHVTEDEVIMSQIIDDSKTYAWAMSYAMGKGFTHIVWYGEPPIFVEQIEDEADDDND